MAAAVVPASAIDLKTPGTFHVRLGASVLKDGEPRRYRNVRYNYKPQPTQGANVTSKMLPGKQANASTISMKDGDKDWEYTGRSREDEEMYVLVITGDGKKDVVLEKLGSSHTMNLTRTPEEKDVESLARKHPYLLENDSDNDDEAIFGDEDDTRDTTPDADNPFDFRHFLKSVEATSQREEPSSQPNRSTAGTPLHKPPTSTPTSRASKPAPSTAAAKKRKTPSAAATRPNPKRVKAGEDPTPTSTPSTKPNPKPQAVPEVRVERKATLPAPSIEQPSQPPSQPDYEDDGELILENSTPDTSQKPTHLSAMSLALSGHLGNRGSGPISLRSAASSPASRINSPHLNGAAKQEGEEFELGGDSSPEQEQHHFEFSYDDDDEVGGDGDVEDSVVPSPPQPEPARQPAAQPRSRRASLAIPAADDEDDMEAQLALAMAAEEEDEEPAPLARVDESDEDVSEEE